MSGCGLADWAWGWERRGRIAKTRKEESAKGGGATGSGRELTRIYRDEAGGEALSAGTFSASVQYLNVGSKTPSGAFFLFPARFGAEGGGLYHAHTDGSAAKCMN